MIKFITNRTPPASLRAKVKDFIGDFEITKTEEWILWRSPFFFNSLIACHSADWHKDSHDPEYVNSFLYILETDGHVLEAEDLESGWRTVVQVGDIFWLDGTELHRLYCKEKGKVFICLNLDIIGEPIADKCFVKQVEEWIKNDCPIEFN